MHGSEFWVDDEASYEQCVTIVFVSGASCTSWKDRWMRAKQGEVRRFTLLARNGWNSDERKAGDTGDMIVSTCSNESWCISATCD